MSALQKHPTLLTVHIPALLSGAGASKVRACPWVPWSQCLCALHPHLSMPCVRLRFRPPSRWRGLPPALPSTAPLSRTCFGSWLPMSVVPRYVADRPAFGRGTNGCTMGEWVWACVCRGVAFRALHPPPPATHTLTPPPRTRVYRRLLPKSRGPRTRPCRWIWASRGARRRGPPRRRFVRQRCVRARAWSMGVFVPLLDALTMQLCRGAAPGIDLVVVRTCRRRGLRVRSGPTSTRPRSPFASGGGRCVIGGTGSPCNAPHARQGSTPPPPHLRPICAHDEHA